MPWENLHRSPPQWIGRHSRSDRSVCGLGDVPRSVKHTPSPQPVDLSTTSVGGKTHVGPTGLPRFRAVSLGIPGGCTPRVGSHRTSPWTAKSPVEAPVASGVPSDRDTWRLFWASRMGLGGCTFREIFSEHALMYLFRTSQPLIHRENPLTFTAHSRRPLRPDPFCAVRPAGDWMRPGKKEPQDYQEEVVFRE